MMRKLKKCKTTQKSGITIFSIRLNFWQRIQKKHRKFNRKKSKEEKNVNIKTGKRIKSEGMLKKGRKKNHFCNI